MHGEVAVDNRQSEHATRETVAEDVEVSSEAADGWGLVPQRGEVGRPSEAKNLKDSNKIALSVKQRKMKVKNLERRPRHRLIIKIPVTKLPMHPRRAIQGRKQKQR